MLRRRNGGIICRQTHARTSLSAAIIRPHFNRIWVFSSQHACVSMQTIRRSVCRITKELSPLYVYIRLLRPRNSSHADGFIWPWRQSATA